MAFLDAIPYQRIVGRICTPPTRLAIRAAREPGQAYVAISRVRTRGGLWLKDKIAGVFVSPDAINFYRNLKNAIR